MFIFDGDPVNDANLNKLFAHDAIVDISVSSVSGYYYPTVAEAVSAGHHNILVMPGEYQAGFTLSSSRIRVVGATPLYGLGSQTISGGARFGGTIAVEGDYCQLENLGVLGSGSYGFTINNGNFVTVKDCAAVGGEDDGFFILGGIENTLVRCSSVNNEQYGFWQAAYSGADSVGVTFRDCWAYANDGGGFRLIETEPTSGYPRVSLFGCVARTNDRAYSGTNFYALGSHGRGLATFVGCHSFGNGNNPHVGNGFAIYSPATSGIRGYAQMVACNAYSNYGVGFLMTAETDRVALIGCQSNGNVSANYQNCAECRGFDVDANYGVNFSG